MPLLVGVTALLFAGGFFADKAGEGANDAANASVKIAVVGIGGYLLLKKAGAL